MKKLIAFVKQIPFKQILGVFLAGVLLVISSACSGGAMAKTSDQVRDEVPKAVNNEYKGGMNAYEDTDPRQNTTAADAKAKALVDNAERNIKNRTGNPAEAIKRVGESAPNSPQEVGRNVKRAAEDVSDRVGGNAESLADRAKLGAKNLKENTKEALKGGRQVVEEATEGAKNKVDEGASMGKRALDKATDAVD